MDESNTSNTSAAEVLPSAAAEDQPITDVAPVPDEVVAAEGSELLNVSKQEDQEGATNTSDDDHNNDIDHNNSDTSGEVLTYNSPEELIEILNKCQQVDLTAETMDPLERTFRKLVPIPEHYYWEVVGQHNNNINNSTVGDVPNPTIEIPRRIKFWHTSIYSLSKAYTWTEQHLALPIARSLGLTEPLLSEVTQFMSDDDWKTSQRIVAERQEANENHMKKITSTPEFGHSEEIEPDIFVEHDIVAESEPTTTTTENNDDNA